MLDELDCDTIYLSIFIYCGDEISDHYQRLVSVGNKARELNKICSGNLYPFFPESIREHILAPTNEADWVIRLQLTPSIFKIVYEGLDGVKNYND